MQHALSIIAYAWPYILGSIMAWEVLLRVRSRSRPPQDLYAVYSNPLPRPVMTQVYMAHDLGDMTRERAAEVIDQMAQDRRNALGQVADPFPAVGDGSVSLDGDYEQHHSASEGTGEVRVWVQVERATFPVSEPWRPRGFDPCLLPEEEA